MTKRRSHLRRSRQPELRTGQSWTHLLFFVFLLVMLLVFYSELGRGAAGCFGAVADPDLELEITPRDEAAPADERTPARGREPLKPPRRAPGTGSVGVEKISGPKESLRPH